MKRSFWVFAGILVLAVLVISISSNDSKYSANGISGSVINEFEGKQISINSGESSFEFTGGKVVGNAHVGTFENWEGSVYVKDGEVVGIEGIAQANSIKTENERVDGHLQTDDFFDVENYPEVKFASTNVDFSNGEITGILQIKDVSKEITFPAEFSDGEVSGEFSFEADEFFKYDVLMTEVGINFDFFY